MLSVKIKRLKRLLGKVLFFGRLSQLLLSHFVLVTKHNFRLLFFIRHFFPAHPATPLFYPKPFLQKDRAE